MNMVDKVSQTASILERSQFSRKVKIYPHLSLCSMRCWLQDDIRSPTAGTVSFTQKLLSKKTLQQLFEIKTNISCDF